MAKGSSATDRERYNSVGSMSIMVGNRYSKMAITKAYLVMQMNWFNKLKVFD